MASTRLDFPAPVGPVKANRSALSKSTTVGSRKAVNPSISRRLGRTGLRPMQRVVEQLGEQLGQPVVVDPLVAEVLAEQLLRCSARGRPRWAAVRLVVSVGGLVNNHVDRLGKDR